MKYRKKPVVIDAVQFTGTKDNFDELLKFTGSGVIMWEERFGDTVNSIGIKTLEGTMKASVNDFIIKGVNGEYYPCKPDIFEKTYEIENE